MSNERNFKVTYYVADGYAGYGERPHYVTIRRSDLSDEMSDSDLIAEVEAAVQHHFEQNVFAETDGEGADFIAWARANGVTQP